MNMEFTIARDEFYKSLQRAQGVVSTKGAMPVLANILIEANEAGLSMFATNLDIGLRGVYKADVKTPGKITVQAKKLHDIVRELPSADIVVKVDDDDRLRVICGKSKFNLATISADEFPAFPAYDETNLVSLESAMIAEMIRKTSFAISTDETRMTLNGALFEVSPTRVRMVATDGHRLAFIERDGAFKVTEPVKCIIARKAIKELVSLLGDDDEPLKFLQHDNHMLFRKGDVALVVRLIEGAFPNYEQVIPKVHTKEVLIPSDAFLQAVRRVQVLADEKSHMIRFALDGTKVELVSEGGELGEAKDEIEVEYSGDELTIGLNSSYIIEVLGNIADDKVMMHLQDHLSPVVLLSPKDPGVLCIVMPMRL